MAKVIRYHEVGGPEVLRQEEIEVGQPGPGQVRLKQGAVALNFADTYFRSGLYPAPLPAGVGSEACGTITAVGDGVTDFKVGDRVTYTGALNTIGAYATERLISAAPLIRLPDNISFETAAAITMRGLTAAYLMRATRALMRNLPGTRSLIPCRPKPTGQFFSNKTGLNLQRSSLQYSRAQGFLKSSNCCKFS